MTDDRELADLLGAAPAAPDPAFRFDVFARIAQRRQRASARQRALTWALGFALVGVAFPLAQVAGLRFEHLQPLAAAAGVLALAYLMAVATIEGPRSALARSRRLLLARL